MQQYYIAIGCAILSVFLFMMWRDVRTLKSRVTDVVEQHNNVKKALDRHESMITSPKDIPIQFMADPEIQPAEDAPVEIKKEPVEPLNDEAPKAVTAKAKKTAATKVSA